MKKLLCTVVLMFGACAMTSCAWIKDKAHDVKSAIVDCTKPERAKLVDEFKPMAQVVITGAIERARGGDGAIDWGQVRSDAGASLKSLGKETGSCVAADLFAGWIFGKSKPTVVQDLGMLQLGSPVCVGGSCIASDPQHVYMVKAIDVSPAAARAGFEALRAELWPGATYHTEAGDL